MGRISRKETNLLTNIRNLLYDMNFRKWKKMLYIYFYALPCDVSPKSRHRSNILQLRHLLDSTYLTSVYKTYYLVIKNCYLIRSMSILVSIISKLVLCIGMFPASLDRCKGGVQRSAAQYMSRAEVTLL